jgi:hypothetical protein
MYEAIKLFGGENEMRTETRIMRLTDSLKELAALGSPVDLEAGLTESEPDQLEIVQCGGVNDNALLELDHGRIGYMLSVCVTNQTSRPTYIIDLDLRVAWDEQMFDWLMPRTIKTDSAKRQKRGSYQLYKFPGKNGLELPVSEVVNGALMRGQSLRPRRPVSGWLLATGGIMPQALLNGDRVNATLSITTSDHVEHCREVDLRVERRRSIPNPSSPKTGLYGSSGIAARRLGIRAFVRHVGEDPGESQKAHITRPDEANQT